MRVKEGDARLSVAEAPEHSYDVALGDAFSSRSVPWHLTTKEFLSQVHGLLRPRGIYVMNLIDAGYRFARAEAKTLQQVFPYVAMLPISHNIILVGSDRALSTAELARQTRLHGAAATPLSGPALTRFIGDAQVLTDDFAPVDQLLK
jgi:spermidine synthase